MTAPDHATDNQEIEIKFHLDKTSLAAVLATPALAQRGTPKIKTLRSIYHDTSDNDLWAAGITVRVRTTNGTKPVLGVKATDNTLHNPFHRNEFEVASPDATADLALLNKALASRLRKASAGKPLVARFEANVRRQSFTLRHGQSMIELVYDEGALVIGPRQLALSELELELKSGAPVDLYQFASQLARQHGLRLDLASKSRKGFQALSGQPAAIVKAVAPKLDSRMTIDQALNTIIGNALVHFVGNWSGLSASDAPELIHQLRVALRRMRSALAIFKNAVPDARMETLRLQARQIASALGAAREIDVFRQSTEAMPTNALPGHAALHTLINTRQRDGYRLARAMIAGAEATAFVLAVQCFLARPPQTEDPPKTQRPASLKSFARDTLNRQLKRVRQRGEDFANQTEATRHKLRIACKNLRYACGFFDGLFAKTARKTTYFQQIATLQDLLGQFNDVSSARMLLADMAAELGKDCERVVGFAMGWLAHDMARIDRQLEAAWQAFSNQEPYWK